MVKSSAMVKNGGRWGVGGRRFNLGRRWPIYRIKVLASKVSTLIVNNSKIHRSSFIIHRLLDLFPPFKIQLILWGVCYCMTACFQPETGCLDVEATNFDLRADEPCGAEDSDNSCPCTYPDLSFGTIDYLVEKIDYAPNTIYQIDGQHIRIEDISFYLSGFQFRQTDGAWVVVEDTISLVVLNEENELVTSIFTDDFQLIQEQNRIEMGAIRQSGTFDSLRFVVGIEGQANSADPEEVSNSSHPLGTNAEMHTGSQSEGYIFNQITLFKDTLTTEETTINILEKNGGLVEIKLPFLYETPIGSDFSIGTLTINHAKWFDGIKFVTDSDAVIIEKIVANTSEVFSVSN